MENCKLILLLLSALYSLCSPQRTEQKHPEAFSKSPFMEDRE